MSQNGIIEGLLPWQAGSYAELEQAFLRHGVAVDASDMGTGKTYKAARLLTRHEAAQLVVCPLSVVPTWERVLAKFGGEATVLNYEQVKLERNGLGRFVDITPWRGPRYRGWEWAPEIDTIVFDEVHRCGGEHSGNSLLLRAAKRQGKRTLALSGTLAESPLQLRALGELLNLYGPGQPVRSWSAFLAWHGVVHTPFGLKFTGRGFPGENTRARQMAVMDALRQRIFPEWGTRLTIEEIGSDFPESQVTAELYRTQNGEEIARLYAELASEVERWSLRSSQDRNPEHPLTRKLRERQFIELLKVPIFEDLARDALAGGYSVVVFTSFLATIEALAKKFPDTEVFYGDMTSAERRAALDRFQSNGSRMITVQIDSGGTGVDLHDLHGGHPRYVLVSPGYSAKNLLQALKRVQRAEAKSKSVQRLVFVAGTVEEEIQKALATKVDNINSLQDEDLLPNFLKVSPLHSAPLSC